MNTTPKSVWQYGSPEGRAQAIPLRAGPATMSFEPETAFLRHIRIGDHELVRAVYGAVRNRDWTTVPARISNLRFEISNDSFQLGFQADCQKDDLDFHWQGSLSGDAQGKIVYQFDGEARSTFLRNRIGLCVLHPILECSGKPCAVERADGTREQGVFPNHISPHQPFKNIRALSYEVAPGVRVEVRCEGDVFEMEDQRNWTDASFMAGCADITA